MSVAYLVIREGMKWTDVYRLVPGQAVTVGRSPTNQIVLRDDRCSRTHAEFFFGEGRWTLRDRESRNGTFIGENRLEKDHALHPGDQIRIGRSQLTFTDNLSTAIADVLPPREPISASRASETIVSMSLASAESEINSPEPTITHRRHQARLLQPDEPEEASVVTGFAKAAAQLCRLAFELGKATDVDTLGRIALGGLFDATKVDAGGVLLFPRGEGTEVPATELVVVAFRSDTSHAYVRPTRTLAETVLREGEAVLARNVTDDSDVCLRDSKGEIHATTVICAPIRHGSRIHGLLHLYSTKGDRLPGPDDLEFTLAVADTLAVALGNVTRRLELHENLAQVKSENQQLRERLGVISELIGTSRAVVRISESIARVAPTQATVLIRGESGVGKELVARAIHSNSPRRKNVFVCLNCAALSETLLESELFGHEKGSFTGATERKIGKFEAAHRGTLMLDEIGEMSPTVQAKFLRVLEGHAFERVGGSDPVKVDVRVIAATNRDLERDVADGRFRRDLYFRLHVMEILVPPLRKRTEDVPELAHYFLRKYNEETGKKIRGFAPGAMDQLVRYRWPGNVRELKNVIERAVVLAESDIVDAQHLMLSKLSTPSDTGELPATNHTAAAADFRPTSLADMERAHIQSTLRATGWNKSQAAAILGIERSTLDRKIRRYELQEGPSRRAGSGSGSGSR